MRKFDELRRAVLLRMVAEAVVSALKWLGGLVWDHWDW